ncbi:MAG: hypothetical protein HYR73_09035 [Candidatus Eisenbacteria bacterium]|nr:hypothetical protein [Candidatus Eisenbacteria bacterium]
MTSRRRPLPTPPALAEPVVPSSAGLVFAALLLTLLLRFFAWFVPSNWLWGVDAFRHWPFPAAAPLVILAAIGFVPAGAHLIERRLDAVGKIWERAGWRADLAACAAIGLLLFFVRDPLHFTGDSGLRAGLVGMAAPPASLLEHAYPLDLLVNFHAVRALQDMGVGGGAALPLVGASVGALFALAGFGFLRAAGARGAALPAGAVALLGGSTLLHFAGYDKYGPLLLGIALAGTGVVQLARRGRGEWTLALGMAVAVLSHRSGYLLAPAALWTFFRAHALADRTGRMRLLAATALMLLVLIALASRTFTMFVNVDRVAHLPGGHVAEARGAGGAPAFLLRISDALNVLSFLVPLWLAGAAAAVTVRRPSGAVRERATDRGARFSIAPTGATALTGISFILFFVAPGGGWPRDWDDATGAGVVMALATSYALVVSWRNGGGTRIRAPIVTLGIAAGIAAFGIQASESIGLRRVHALATSAPELSDPIRAGMYDFLGVRAINAGRGDQAAAMFERAVEVGGPNPRILHEVGLAYLRAGKLAPARSAFTRAATLSRTVAAPWVGLARIAVIEKDTLAAIAALDSALLRAPYDAENLRFAASLRGARGVSTK